jgi:hypothetical protein
MVNEVEDDALDAAVEADEEPLFVDEDDWGAKNPGKLIFIIISVCVFIPVLFFIT